MSEPRHPSAVATFGTTSARQPVGCRVCGRTLLLGERSVGFFTQVGDGPFDVCELCVARAHRFGLRPRPASADDVVRAHSRGIGHRLVALVGGSRPARRAARTSAPDEGTAAVAAAAVASSRRTRKRRATAAPLDQQALGAVPVGSAAIPVALAAFNQSSHARTLAGLHRTLGAPRASVAPRSGTDREVILTVAWEIVWYQFRIMPEGIEQQRGQYLSELQPRWQQWNCHVGTDGTVRERDDVDRRGQEDLHAPRPEEPAR